MKINLSKKAACVLALANLIAVFGTAGCSTGQEKETDPRFVGTPETTEAPPSDVNELMAGGDKDYYVPFRDSDHSYSLINEGLGTPVRQQGMGGCYCYAAVTSMQSSYLKDHGVLIDINPVDIINRIYEMPEKTDGEDPEYDEEKFYVATVQPLDLGGDVSRVTGALCADPLNGYLVSEANIFGGFNTGDTDSVTEEDIKGYIREYGAICLAVNYKKDCKYINGYYTQNYQKNAEDRDHVAAIVGWDDDFPADCFKTPATRNGAWLVQNSFGDFWGNCGFYWVSYDMPIPEFYNCSVTKEYSSAISYGRFPMATVYSPDVIDKLGPEMDFTNITTEDITKGGDVSVATVYEKKGSVGAVGFWTYEPGQPYTVEILDGEFGKVLTSASGTFKHSGYHTVKFDKPVSVKKFTVVVRTAGLAVFEGESMDNVKVYTILQKAYAHYEAKSQPGRSFIQVGEEWVDVTDPSLKSRLGLDDAPAFENASDPGDPCITVLFI